MTRLVAEVAGREHSPWLRSEHRPVMDNAYPELVEALDRRGGPRFVADGEIVAFDGDNTSFAAL